MKLELMQQVIFEALRNVVTMAPMLISSDTSTLFHIKTNNSDFTIGAELSQASENSK